MARAWSMVLVAPAFLLALSQAGQAAPASTGNVAPPGHPPRSASISVIQAVPGATVDVAIDGESVSDGAELGTVLGPFDLTAGSHTVTFTGDAVDVASQLEVATGSSTDVVLHLPAELAGDPVVHSYEAPTGAIGPDKARVVLAHTATVAPADVRVNGETVFTNIANGEFAEAELPSGTHRVALLPSGEPGPPILGPVEVALDARTLSMVYAYGNPSDGSMNVIMHTTSLSDNGAVQPTTIRTGSTGAAADLDVISFSSVPAKTR